MPNLDKTSVNTALVQMNNTKKKNISLPND